TITAVQNIDFDQSFQSNTEQMRSAILSWTHFTQVCEHRLVLLFALLIIICFVSLKLYKVHRRHRKLNVGQKGDSRFTTLNEHKKTYRRVHHKDNINKSEISSTISHYKDQYCIDQ